MPKLHLTDCDVVWSERTAHFFLPFRIEANCLVYARYQGAVLPSEQPTNENKNVHIIPLYQLFVNHERRSRTTPIEFNPSDTKIVGIYAKGIRVGKRNRRMARSEGLGGKPE